MEERSTGYRMLMGFHETTTSEQIADGDTVAQAIQQGIEEADQIEGWKRSDAVSDAFVIELGWVDPQGNETPVPIPWGYSEAGTILNPKAKLYDLERPESAVFRVEWNASLPDRIWSNGWRVAEVYVIGSKDKGTLSLERDMNGFLDYEIEHRTPCPERTGWYVIEGVTGKEIQRSDAEIVVRWDNIQVRAATDPEIEQARIEHELATDPDELEERMEAFVVNTSAAISGFTQTLAAAIQSGHPKVASQAAIALDKIEKDIATARRICDAQPSERGRK